MSLKFFNTLTRSKEVFEPLHPGEARMYTCGPTVYENAHIGNFRAYLFEDLLRRYLKYRGYKVIQVMNITDVDDKTIRDSRAAGIKLQKYTKRFKEAFFEDLRRLNIEPAEYYPEATAHIPEMLNLIKRLKEKGYTYESGGSTYFRIGKFPDYGKLSGHSLADLRPGERVESDEYEKEGASDFALWKARKAEDGEVYWDSEFGPGRPGWHIECSAMSMKYLGETFDIHTGGEDNIFPHHENERAQSEAATGKPFAKFWMHCGYLLVEGSKMSKSQGNFFTLEDIMERGFSAEAVRYTLITPHYRQQFNFTMEGLEASAAAIARLQDFIASLESVGNEGECPEADEILPRAQQGFAESMDDDLNIAPAMGSVFTMVRDFNRLISEKRLTADRAEKIIGFMKEVNSVIGALNFEEAALDDEIEKLIEEREAARAERDFSAADRIRDQLLSMGIKIEDTGDGTRWKRIQ